MERMQDARVPKGKAIAIAIVVSIVPIYWTGIGGVLIALCASVAAVIIASSALSKDSREVEREIEGSAQLEGVLDSSQLDAADGVYHEPVVYDRARRYGKVVVAIGLAVSLISSALVLASTAGRGVHFYLGGHTLFPSAVEDSSTSHTTHKNPSSKTSTSGEESYSEEWTYYPVEDTQEDTWEGDGGQQETAQPTNTPTNQSTPEPSEPAQPAQPTETPTTDQGDTASPTSTQTTEEPNAAAQNAPAAADQTS
ncbi:MAG: hypothetical protein Q4A01_04105 [Coriobacteriales bacterium]|nr:hypothetical protein [Coriobacteriales bacterium]